MPEPLDKHAVDLLSAALRHVRDAEHLATPNHSGHSPDQAYHLAGFGPECARKATLYHRLFDKPLGHTLGVGATTALGSRSLWTHWPSAINPEALHPPTASSPHGYLIAATSERARVNNLRRS